MESMFIVLSCLKIMLNRLHNYLLLVFNGSVSCTRINRTNSSMETGHMGIFFELSFISKFHQNVKCVYVCIQAFFFQDKQVSKVRLYLKPFFFFLFTLLDEIDELPGDLCRFLHG